MDSRPHYVVGIDLGTTNSALAYADLGRGEEAAADLALLPIPQLVAPGETAARRLLPSSCYLPGEHELPPGATRLPWGDRPVVVGELARRQGERVPARLVGSAKSWLCHPRADRTAPILPWGAPAGVPRISPVEASTLVLAHLRDAWDARFPGAPLAAQEVVLTVPASFDEVARELTVQAARQIGLTRLVLLEEPQAAFYSWTAAHRQDLLAALGSCRLILVCDVGGGTTDFSLISAGFDGQLPALRRLAVGDHLLLGGDNMDAALARQIEARWRTRLDALQYAQLVAACRGAKEALLLAGGPPRASLAVVGRGSRLVGSALSAELTREEVLQTVLDGFFPRTGPDETPARAARAGLQELGLPYAADPAVTRHVLQFLRRHGPEVEQAAGIPCPGGLPRPDGLLLNGGVFTPPAIGERLQQAVAAWFPDQPPPVLLVNDQLDVAVARGAAYYGLVRRGLGLRIGGGTARAYFIGIDVPGVSRQGLCVVPRHLEEGREIELARPFALRVDRPVRFPLHASAPVRAELPGELVPLDEEQFTPLPPIQTVLRGEGPPGKSRGGTPGTEIPVRIRAGLTELGTLELWCVAEQGGTRWKLEFQLRGAVGADETPSVVAPMPRKAPEAKELVERVFGKKPVEVDRNEVKGLVRSLERLLGPRAEWSTPLIRELWTVLHAGLARRRRSADHERIWCSLTGFCLRPGFGAPLDGWRAAETWKVFEPGLQFVGEPHNWEAWWVLWRRIAGGLEAPAQERLFEAVAPHLRPAAQGKGAVQTKRPKAGGRDELIRLLASLERLSPATKAEAGEWLFGLIQREGPAPHLLWALGRLGARLPFAGSGHSCLPPEQAEGWIERLLALPPPIPDGLGFALVQLARLTGDRARDIDPALGERVQRRMRELGAPPEWLQALQEVAEASAADEQRIFGESLPAGLRLILSRR